MDTRFKKIKIIKITKEIPTNIADFTQIFTIFFFCNLKMIDKNDEITNTDIKSIHQTFEINNILLDASSGSILIIFTIVD